MKIKTAMFETRQQGKWLQKNNTVVPESDGKPQTEHQVYSCFDFNVFVALGHLKRMLRGSTGLYWKTSQSESSHGDLWRVNPSRY